MGKYKVKDIGVDVLCESKGKIATENLFMRDVELTRMFAVYCLDNITYLEKYEKDDAVYEYVRLRLLNLINELDKIDACFKEHNQN